MTRNKDGSVTFDVNDTSGVYDGESHTYVPPNYPSLEAYLDNIVNITSIQTTIWPTREELVKMYPKRKPMDNNHGGLI